MPRRRTGNGNPEAAGGTLIALVGFMGAGKTSVGRRLAKLLGWPFLDADEEIARGEGRSIERIFKENGEEGFRELEAAFVNTLKGKDRLVVALGGGAVTREDTLRRLLSSTFVVYLKTSAEALRSRLEAGEGPDRPLWPRGTFPESLLAARLPLYERAHISVETDGRTPDAVAEEILSRLAPARRAD